VDEEEGGAAEAGVTVIAMEVLTGGVEAAEGLIVLGTVVERDCLVGTSCRESCGGRREEGRFIANVVESREVHSMDGGGDMHHGPDRGSSRHLNGRTGRRELRAERQTCVTQLSYARGPICRSAAGDLGPTGLLLQCTLGTLLLLRRRELACTPRPLLNQARRWSLSEQDS
jgi:hypothetical protein